MMADIYDDLIPHAGSSNFPHWVVDKFREIGINGCAINGYGGLGFNNMEYGSLIYEIARKDYSLFLFFIVLNSLGSNIIADLGNEEQKQRILTETIPLKKMICFGLTEPDNGSDASGLQTFAKKVDGGFVINGAKRWIGLGHMADYIIVWARNEDEGNKVQGFIVTKGSKGLAAKKIEGKFSTRLMENADIQFHDVFVPDHNRLAKATNFATGANRILRQSRLIYAWSGVGIAAGAYEAALKYCLQRK
mmetsp:Transcript_24010/g.36908  ORF Transcript_24010/g.36908 Transcript_24010/m.36908 type:complete len:248 (+) Transcript_24010:186-929(+)